MVGGTFVEGNSTPESIPRYYCSQNKEGQKGPQQKGKNKSTKKHKKTKKIPLCP